jgi:hypothetical protein
VRGSRNIRFVVRKHERSKKSQALGMTKGRVALPFGVRLVMTSSETLFIPGETCRRQVKLLRMNKWASGRVGGRSSEQQVPPLRYAPVGMTIHLRYLHSPWSTSRGSFLSQVAAGKLRCLMTIHLLPSHSPHIKKAADPFGFAPDEQNGFPVGI